MVRRGYHRVFFTVEFPTFLFFATSALKEKGIGNENDRKGIQREYKNRKDPDPPMEGTSLMSPLEWEVRWNIIGGGYRMKLVVLNFAPLRRRHLRRSRTDHGEYGGRQAVRILHQQVVRLRTGLIFGL